MASNRYELVKAKMRIYKNSIQRALKILSEAGGSAAGRASRAAAALRAGKKAVLREESWVLLSSLAAGALFEIKIDERCMKTAEETHIGVGSISLATGVRRALDPNTLVRRLTIKEDEHAR